MSATLLLNADGMPVSYMPLSTITWEDAIKYMVLDKANVLLFHENWIVHSATWENCTTACGTCNANKADKVGIKPMVKPYKPEYFDLVNKRKKQGFQVHYEEWLPYIH